MNSRLNPNTALRMAIGFSEQVRTLREREFEALRFVAEGAYLVNGQWYEVKRIPLSANNPKGVKAAPKFTKVIRKTTAARAERVGVQTLE